MTRETTLYHVCDRPHPETSQEVLAKHVDKFSLNGYRYEIETCDACSGELYGQLMAWADLGVLVGEPTVFDRPVKPTAQTVVVTPALAPPPSAPPERRKREREVLPRTAERWKISQHAQERTEQRGFSREEVLWACERPEVVEQMDGGAEHRRRGRCLVVVQPRTFHVLTVKVAGETRHTWQENSPSPPQQQKGA